MVSCTLLLLVSNLVAQGAPVEERPATRGGRVTIDEENDAFLRSDDRYYTQGLRIQFLWNLSDDFIRRRLSFVPMMDKPVVSASTGFFVGHNIYTPENLLVTTFEGLANDRPFAGMASAGGVLHLRWLRSKKLMSRLRLEAVVATYGDWSLAGPVQVGVHRLFREASGRCRTGPNDDFDDERCRPIDPPGWRHDEVKIAPGVGIIANARYESDVWNWLAPLGRSWDAGSGPVAALDVAAPASTPIELFANVSLRGETSLGTIFDSVSAGVIGRVGAGWSLSRAPGADAFPSIDEAGIMNKHLADERFMRSAPQDIEPAPRSVPYDVELMLFARTQAYFVPYNRFLDNEVPFVRDFPDTERVLGHLEGELGAMAKLGVIELGGSLFARTAETLHQPTARPFQPVARLRLSVLF